MTNEPAAVIASVNMTQPLPFQRPLARLRLDCGTVVHLETVTSMTAAEAAWRQLCGPDHLATAYQNYDFCSLWLEHVGKPAGATPFIVIGRSDSGAPLFLWPLILAKTGPCSIATYFCGSHANFQTTLWRSDIAMSVTAGDLRAILKQIAARGVDALVLLNQPESCNGLSNPLHLLRSQASPDTPHGISLHGTGEAIIARHLNAETRRKFRRKEQKLAALPGYRYTRACTEADVDRYLDAFMQQKAARFAARGIRNGFAEPGMRDFLRAACKHGIASGQPLIELHALDSDDDVLALFAGLHDNRCFAAIFNSYTLGEPARWSPGFTLLLKLVDQCAKRGFDSLDLGIGAAEYKSSLCDIEGRHFDNFIGLSLRGRILCQALRAVHALKRSVKRRPALTAFAYSIRAKLFARRPAS